MPSKISILYRYLSFCLAVPLFYTAFCLLYNPFGIKEFYDFGKFGFSFHLTMIGCIIFVVLLLTRGILHMAEKIFDISFTQYAAVCLVEIGITSCFIALYITLFNIGFLYFNVLTDTVKSTLLIEIFPYVCDLYSRYINSLKKKENKEADPVIKFYDEHKRLKLSIDSSMMLSICAESNYIKINYVENGKLKSYLLRNSMKSQEQNAPAHGLVRCHRSFYINPRYVTTLIKDKDGLISARLNAPEPMAVPVSKQYYESLSSML